MRVLMTVDTVGGVWTYAVELAGALGEHGVEVILCTMGAAMSGEQRGDVRALRNVRVYESSYKLEWMEEPWEDVRAAGQWLLEVAAQTQPQLVHLNGYVHAALPWQVPVVVVAHSCVCSWWRAVWNEEAPAAWDHYRRMVADGLAHADAVVAPTAAMLAQVRKHYGVQFEGRVIYNARRASLFGSGPKEPLAMCAGRLWDEGKNVGALARCAPDLPWPVYAAGERLAPLARSSSTPHGLHALGRLDTAALAGWLGRATIYVAPARYEPFGLAALEAALSGCVLVLGDIDSLREVWGDAAVFVPPNDVVALRRVLLALMDDDAAEDRARLAHRARERAGVFSPQRKAAAYLDLYRQLTHRGRSRCAS